jgi:Tat protein translocase TatB subunit
MFDISIGKLIIIATVAFIVIGPERFPQVARTVGLILGRFQRYIAGIKKELRQEMEKAEFAKIEEEFKATQTDMKKALQGLKTPPAETHYVKDNLANHDTILQPDSDNPILSQLTEQATPSSRNRAFTPSIPSASPFTEEQLDLFDEVPKLPISTKHRDRR